MLDREKLKTLGQKLAKSKYVLLVLLLGLVFILWPTKTAGEGEETAPAAVSEGLSFSLENEEARLEEILSLVSGAGEVVVRLSLKGGVEQELADSAGETLVVSGDDGEEAVQLRYLYPEYQGAVIVCSGADNAAVRLAVTEAVSNYTGLGSDRITVMKMSK